MKFLGLTITLPKKKGKKGGVGSTDTYDESSDDGIVSIPSYNDHREDIFQLRASEDSRDIIKRMMSEDPDMSAAVNAYLTTSDTKPLLLVRDLNGEIDKNGMDILRQTIDVMTRRNDYTLGFQLKPKLSAICEKFRYMLLLRGAIGGELILDKMLIPTLIRNIDMASIEWTEKKAGEYKPKQKAKGRDDLISMDIPTFFVEFFRQDPTSIYSKSFFTSSINTIAARQLVINELYRIMQVTGFPRIHVTVVEEVIKKSAPANVQNDPKLLKEYITARLNEISGVFGSLRSDQPFISTDSTTVGMVNDKNPGASLRIEEIINTLNAQNQAALKTMASIIGRGESGVNTASVEARTFAMNADALNEPVGAILSDLFSMALHLQGYQGYVEVTFSPAELRPALELEPQLTMRQSRFKSDLSLGIISDEEYHLQVYGRPMPEGAPQLAGTGFMEQTDIAVDETEVSPNGDPLGRSLTSKGSKSAKSKDVKA